MIFLTTVMDEETNTNNSVEHYDDHAGCKPVRRLVPGLHMHVDVDITITEASSFLQ